MEDKTLVRVDLGPLPFMRAIEMIKWCFEHNVDRARCLRYIESMGQFSPTETGEWYIMMPEKLLTFFAIKWS